MEQRPSTPGQTIKTMAERRSQTMAESRATRVELAFMDAQGGGFAPIGPAGSKVVPSGT